MDIVTNAVMDLLTSSMDIVTNAVMDLLTSSMDIITNAVMDLLTSSMDIVTNAVMDLLTSRTIMEWSGHTPVHIITISPDFGPAVSGSPPDLDNRPQGLFLRSLAG
ncbi:hypothetical protein Pcinc_036892 [Petrolisthes cinctipes]|uniref:Uncharacterized protein n=1 Tax=Petrolisthes cinctipes TaxID=88211 RepID=A0AAE1EPB5_PETCI|nr:hypothetical protein Pcinc_036892 [Petrolisthes cinctipes]